MGRKEWNSTNCIKHKYYLSTKHMQSTRAEGNLNLSGQKIQQEQRQLLLTELSLCRGGLPRVVSHTTKSDRTPDSVRGCDKYYNIFKNAGLSQNISRKPATSEINVRSNIVQKEDQCRCRT